MSRDMENNVQKTSGTGEVKPDQNIQLTVVRSSETAHETVLDFAHILEGWKRFLALWLVLAVSSASMIAGIGLIRQRDLYDSKAKAMIHFVQGEEQQNLLSSETANSTTETAKVSIAENAGVTRLQSAALVTRAMERLGMNIEQLDKIRNGISIQDVLTDSDNERISLYRTLLSKNSLTINAVQEVLENQLSAESFIISLDYRNTSLTPWMAAQLLDEILRCYTEEFELTHNATDLPVVLSENESSEAMEALDGYRDQLELYRNWLQTRIYLQATGKPADQMTDTFDQWLKKNRDLTLFAFRSKTTGLTLLDLLDETERLLSSDYQMTASFVISHSIVFGNRSEVLNRYQGSLEEATRARKTAQSKYTALEEAVKAYERDTSVYYVPAEGEPLQRTAAQDSYDSMVLQMLTLQEQMSLYRTEMLHDQNRIAAIKKADEVSDADLETARRLLKDLGEKVGMLTKKLSSTVLEYNQEAIKLNTVEVLVPAIVEPRGTSAGEWQKMLMIVEVLLLLGWLGAGVVFGLKQSAMSAGKPVSVKETAGANEEARVK